MGRPGSALDNAVIESWHSTLEFELRRIEHFATRAAARAGVAAWIEDYNHHRRHSSLGRISPVDYERSAGGKGRRVTAAGRCAAQDQDGGGLRRSLFHRRAAALQAGGRAARGYGAAPPASRPAVTAGQPRTVTLPGTRTREAGLERWRPLAAPEAGKAGRRQPAPARGAARPVTTGPRAPANARERSELAFDSQKERKNYTNPLTVSVHASRGLPALITLVMCSAGVPRDRAVGDGAPLGARGGCRAGGDRRCADRGPVGMPG